MNTVILYEFGVKNKDPLCFYRNFVRNSCINCSTFLCTKIQIAAGAALIMAMNAFHLELPGEYPCKHPFKHHQTKKYAIEKFGIQVRMRSVVT